MLISAVFEQPHRDGEISGCAACRRATWRSGCSPTLTSRHVRMQTQLHKFIWEPQTRGV